MNERQVKKQINPDQKFELSGIGCGVGEFSPSSIYAQYLSLEQAGGQRTSRDELGERARLKLHKRREALAKVIARRRGLEHA